jgi:predicted dithiol-disulfide oxidoreductase (DUF899 family)
MSAPQAVSREEWIIARKSLLSREKEFTKERDAISAARRELPWVKIETPYVFQGPQGEVSLLDLFDGRRQLTVYHLMYAPDWDTPCKSCSFWADHFDGMLPHLAARDVTLVAISRAPLQKIEAMKERMGWKFPWYSSNTTSFNFDFGVSFTQEQLDSGKAIYNYEPLPFQTTEMPGVSTFIRDEAGNIFHTYSAFYRGIDALNLTYQYLDVTPLGRHEEGLPEPMDWVRLHDEYKN